MVGIYQHRRVEIVPGDQAGSFKMVLIDCDAISAYCAGRYIATCEAYIAGYEATGLRQSLGACYGRIGLPSRNPISGAFERMGDGEMSAWRRWSAWRGRMTSLQASVVDDVLLYGLAPSNRRLLNEGLERLSRVRQNY